MKPVSMFARENFRHLVPCIHGGEVWATANKTGLKREEIYDFSSSINPLGPSKKALDALRCSFEQISMYPDSDSTILRNAIASHFDGITKDNIIVGNGSTELIYLFSEAFLKNGDMALIPAPSFGEYESAVRRAGAKPLHVKLNRDFHANPSSFIETMYAKTKVKALYFCNPNNPTSILTPPEDLAKIIEGALANDVLVFLDEDFLEFVEEGQKFSCIRKVEKYPNLFVLRSFTKIFGLTGLRIGYGIASKEMTALLSNAKIPWNVNCLGQAAAVEALNDKAHLEKTLELIKIEKRFLLNNLHSTDLFKIYPADANFLFIDIRKSGYTAAQFKEKMLAYGILIRDCSSFVGLDEYYTRVAVKTREENEKLIAAFEKALSKC